jgi:hypothetical protein
MEEMQDFISSIRKSIDTKCFVKLTLSKPVKHTELLNVYIRLTEIKNLPHVSLTYHFKNNDQVKNFSVDEGLNELQTLATHSFQHCTLFTTEADVLLRISKKGKAELSTVKPTFTEAPSVLHDRQKIKRATNEDAYLIALGVFDAQGLLIPKMADKFRQINKYLEVIESLVKTTILPPEINVVDMGSGKGYLTFALYDYLKNKLNLQVRVTGIEQRSELVVYCNSVAQVCGFDNLKFENKSIDDFAGQQADIVIALHACDTATDDAIAKAIVANASLIVCAPCCHKQIRQQVKGKEQESPLMKYGIFKERQFEMVTDTMRALILEKKNYTTKIFEFVSNEHTRKNILLVGAKTKLPVDADLIDQKLDAIKKAYQIDYHYLEKIV